MPQVVDPGSVERTTAVQFTYNHSTGTRTLNLRLNPNGINWSYELNTNVVDTFGGQVIQILGIAMGEMTITGQFGREGAWGSKKANGEFVRRRGAVMSGVAPKDPDEQFDYNDNYEFGIGLTQMMNYFREYFQISTQGGSATSPGRFAQIPMTLSYDNDVIAGATADADQPDFTSWGASAGTWLIIPTGFPSYHRSNEAFAPEWQVTAEIVQVPLGLKENVINKAIARLHAAIGWKPLSPWNAPLSEVESSEQLNKTITLWHAILPNFTKGDVTNLIYRAISNPVLANNLSKIKNPDKLNTATGGTVPPTASPIGGQGIGSPIPPPGSSSLQPITAPAGGAGSDFKIFGIGAKPVIVATPAQIAAQYPANSSFHKKGYDMEVAEGTPVYAPADGKVPHFYKQSDKNYAIPGQDPNPSAWEFNYDAEKNFGFQGGGSVKVLRFFFSGIIPLGASDPLWDGAGQHYMQGQLMGYTIGKVVHFASSSQGALDAIITPPGVTP